jgi:predicted ATPase/DNA-binding SARP family transcriptional activator/DNA-binding CsgD family transcriptional regulator
MRAEPNILQAEGRAKDLGAVRIGLLGGYSVTVGERKVDESAWRLRKAASLIKLLALAPGHHMHRERAMDLLWPESGKKAASNNLRQTIHAVRRVLTSDPAEGPFFLASQDESLVLCPEDELWVDVDAFEEAAATARRSKEPAAYRVAIELYSGELLPKDRYEEWAQSRRQELKETFLSLLVELARLYEERGEEGLESAVQALQRVLAEEPTNEEAHVGLMRLYALSGRQGEALRQYGRLSEALSGGLGTEPSVSTRALREEIAAGRFPGGSTQLSATRAGPSAGEPPGGARAHNLPAQRTGFVGREREMLGIKRSLAMTRLLTLSGAGGSGKTRLALEVGRDLVGAYPDGVWSTELAGISDGELVPQAVAEVLRVQEQPAQPLTETLVESLHNKSMLLVLDNCEHLIDAAARLVDALLDGCPRVRILATSREALAVAGETLWPVPALSVPSSQRMPTVAELEGYEAVRLFVERASDRRAGFALGPANAEAVAEACRRLEGVPLAIELAAARVGTMSVEEISERLGDSLGLLIGGGRTAVPRQRTLRGALDWSHELLSNEEQTLFGRLSVFAGGWTLEAAEAVAAREGIGESDILESLSGLVDKSLVVAEVSQGTRVRYRLLEPVRQYALEKLEESGEAESVRRRHTEHFLTLAEEADLGWWGPDQGTWLKRLVPDHDNMRAALSWTLERDEVELGLRIAGALQLFWSAQGHYGEGREWLEEALAKDDGRASAAARAGALEGLGWLAYDQDDLDRAEAAAKEGLELSARAVVEGSVTASLQDILGCIAEGRGDYAHAKRLNEESLKLYQKSRDRRGVAFCLNNLGKVYISQGDHKRAKELYQEGLALSRELGGVDMLINFLINLGYVSLLEGDHERAMALNEEAAGLCRDVGQRDLFPVALDNVGWAALLLGDREKAETSYAGSLTLCNELGRKMIAAESLEGLACAAEARGEATHAARLFGAARALRETVGYQTPPETHNLRKPYLTRILSQLDEAAWEAAFKEGQAMSFEEAIEYALSEQMSVTSDAPAPDQPSAIKQSSTLTAREREVAAMIAQGLSNRQIAQGLYLSEHTVKRHISKILRKLGLASRAEVAAWATERLLLAPSE